MTLAAHQGFTEPQDIDSILNALIARGRAAMDAFDNHDQARIDEAVTALAWSIYKPENAEALAVLAVEDTGLGNVPSKRGKYSISIMNSMASNASIDEIRTDRDSAIPNSVPPARIGRRVMWRNAMRVT